MGFFFRLFLFGLSLLGTHQITVRKIERFSKTSAYQALLRLPLLVGSARDGLQYLAFGLVNPLRLNGDYPTGSYTFVCDVHLGGVKFPMMTIVFK